MQVVSPGFATRAMAPGRRPRSVIAVQWDGASWTDESARLLEHSGNLQLGAPGEELTPPGQVGDATIVLADPDGRYGPSGALAEYVAGPAGLFGVRVKIEVGFSGDAGLVQIFTGVVYSWETGPRLTLYCRDMGLAYLQHRLSSGLYTGLRADALIAAYAELAGIGAGARRLDPSSFIIPYGWLEDASVVEEMWEVARSEGAYIWFDQLGQLRFLPVQGWAGRVATGPDMTLGERYGRWSETPEADALATAVTVEWSGLQQGEEETIYELEGARTLRPGETASIVAVLARPCYLYVPPAAGDLRAVSAAGLDLTDDVALELPEAERCAERCTVRLTNNHPSQAVIITRLRLRGYTLTGGPTDQVRVAADPPPTPLVRERSVRGNRYMQTGGQAAALAAFLADRYRWLPQVVTLADVPGQPQIELGDLVRWTPTGPAGELIANGSFEVDTAGWSLGGNDAALFRTQTLGAAAGAWAMRAIFSTDTPANGWLLSAPTSVIPGEMYLATGWWRHVRLGAGDDGVELRLRFLDADGEAIQPEHTLFPPLNGNVSEWTQWSIEARAPAGAVKANVYAQAFTGGNAAKRQLSVAFDGFSLRRPYRQGFVIGLSWRFGLEVGYRQQLRLLDAGRLYQHDNYFIVGQTGLGTAGRAWY